MVAGNGRRSQLAAVAEPPLILDPEIDEELEELEAISRGIEEHTLSANTRRAYENAWRSFKWFCGSHSLEALPAHPEAARWYVAWMSTQTDEWGLPRFATATIRQHLAGVANRHVKDGYLDPTGHKAVSDLVRGLAKLRTTRPARKRALLLDNVVGLLASMDHDVYPNGVSAARDSVALSLGLAGALRRSEAAGCR